MIAVAQETRLSIEDYLAREKDGEVRHEFVGGYVYNMAGASRVHNIIAGNAFTDINLRLRGGPCQAYMSDMKVRLQLGADDVFYYPDVLVTCDPRDRETDHYVCFPKLIVEVLSPATERLDRREKFFAYLQIPTLEEYVLLDQDQPRAMVYRKGDGWTGHPIDGQLELRSLGFELNLPALRPAPGQG